jgi:hypothetical protein
MDEHRKEQAPPSKRAAVWLILIGMVAFGTLELFLMIDGIWLSEDPWIVSQAKEHFAAVVGLPTAALAALFVVAIFEATTGPIEFEGFGFKFRGAEGPIVFWAICFLAISGSIKLLW